MPLLNKNAVKMPNECVEYITNYVSENGVKLIFVGRKLGLTSAQLSQVMSGYRKINSVEIARLKKLMPKCPIKLPEKVLQEGK